jgi:heptosyltransferase-1
VLVIVLDNIGDLVFSSVVFDALRARWPSAELGIFCKDYARDVATLLETQPKIFCADPFWDSAPGRSRGSPREFLRVCLEIRRWSPDHAVVLSRSWKALGAARLCGVSTCIGWDTGFKSRLLASVSVKVPSPSTPVTSEMLSLCSYANLEYRNSSDGLSLSRGAPRYKLARSPGLEAKRHQFAKLLSERGLNRPFVVLHAFAGHRRRCWSLDRWLELANALDQRGYEAFWTGSSAEIAEIESVQGSVPWSSKLLGTKRFLDAAAVTLNAAAHIGHDSGPLHVAAGLGVPVVGLYLPSTPERTGPSGQGDFELLTRSLPANLEVNDVLAALDRLFGRSSRA